MMGTMKNTRWGRTLHHTNRAGRVWRALAAAALAASVTGCIARSYCSPERYEKGLVVVLPGIEGRSMFNDAITGGLHKAGVPYALELHDWTSGVFLAFLPHLVSYDLNRHSARGIADRLARYAKEHPGRPIWLVGQSGGGGVAAFVLEELPKGVDVAGAVLLAPALGPDYNLAPAMRHCRTALYNYYSPGDVLFLGLGTTVFGTIDRAHGSAAGRVGFHLPSGLTPEEQGLYSSRLVQVNCSAGHFQGHVGLHLTSSDANFVAYTVAVPILEHAGLTTHAPEAVRVARAAATQPSGRPVAPMPTRRVVTDVASAPPGTAEPIAAPVGPTTPQKPSHIGPVVRVVGDGEVSLVGPLPATGRSVGADRIGSVPGPPRAPVVRTTGSAPPSGGTGQPKRSWGGVRGATPIVRQPAVARLPAGRRPASAKPAHRLPGTAHVAPRVGRSVGRTRAPLFAPVPGPAPRPGVHAVGASTQPTADRVLAIPGPAAFRLVDEAGLMQDRPGSFRGASSP